MANIYFSIVSPISVMDRSGNGDSASQVPLNSQVKSLGYTGLLFLIFGSRDIKKKFKNLQKWSSVSTATHKSLHITGLISFFCTLQAIKTVCFINTWTFLLSSPLAAPHNNNNFPIANKISEGSEKQLSGVL